PVGALTSKPFRYSARTWELQRRKSVSPHDGIGANLVVQVKGDRVMRVLPLENEAVNECWISDKDRFSYEALNSTERLTKPMVKQDGKWHEVDWNVALDYVSHALRDVIKSSGADAVGALASPHSTLEELYLLQKLMRGLGGSNIDFRLRQRDFSADAKRKGAPWLGMRLADVAGLESTLLVGSLVRKEQPLFAQRLRQAAKRGAQVNLLTVGADDPLIKLHVKSVVAPSQLAGMLAGVLKAAASKKSVATPLWAADVKPCANAEKIADSLIAAGDKGAVFLGNIAQQQPNAAQLHAIAQEIAKLTGAKLGFLGEAANSVGAYVASAVGSGLNAYEMLAQPRQAYVVVNADAEYDFHNTQLAVAAFKQAKSVVVMSAFLNAAALEYADVLLPIAPYTETAGTFINTEGRVQSFKGVVKPLGETRPAWKVLRVLGNLLKVGGFDYENAEQVRDDAVAMGEFVSGKLDNGLGEIAIELPKAIDGLQRVGSVPIYAADALVRRAESLQQTSDAKAPTAGMAAATAAQLGLSAGDNVKLKQGSGVAVLPVQIEENVPAGCVRVVAASAATAALGDLFGTISVERA
ncbi:MAG TPA: molybdopterin-dependent oxidoreductase, partial [Rhodocyclaceae bacterium]|nr:molybdopterin-dependent oxidoreductase [Rhodocyclaceae bacterium]